MGARNDITKLVYSTSDGIRVLYLNGDLRLVRKYDLQGEPVHPNDDRREGLSKIVHVTTKETRVMEMLPDEILEEVQAFGERLREVYLVDTLEQMFCCKKVKIGESSGGEDEHIQIVELRTCLSANDAYPGSTQTLAHRQVEISPGTTVSGLFDQVGFDIDPTTQRLRVNDELSTVDRVLCHCDKVVLNRTSIDDEMHARQSSLKYYGTPYWDKYRR